MITVSVSPQFHVKQLIILLICLFLSLTAGSKSEKALRAENIDSYVLPSSSVMGSNNGKRLLAGNPPAAVVAQEEDDELVLFTDLTDADNLLAIITFCRLFPDRNKHIVFSPRPVDLHRVKKPWGKERTDPGVVPRNEQDGTVDYSIGDYKRVGSLNKEHSWKVFEVNMVRTMEFMREQLAEQMDQKISFYHMFDFAIPRLACGIYHEYHKFDWTYGFTPAKAARFEYYSGSSEDADSAQAAMEAYLNAHNGQTLLRKVTELRADGKSQQLIDVDSFMAAKKSFVFFLNGAATEAASWLDAGITPRAIYVMGYAHTVLNDGETAPRARVFAAQEFNILLDQPAAARVLAATEKNNIPLYIVPSEVCKNYYKYKHIMDPISGELKEKVKEKSYLSPLHPNNQQLKEWMGNSLAAESRKYMENNPIFDVLPIVLFYIKEVLKKEDEWWPALYPVKVSMQLAATGEQVLAMTKIDFIEKESKAAVTSLRAFFGNIPGETQEEKHKMKVAADAIILVLQQHVKK